MLKTLGAVATASVVTPRDALARVFGATRSTGRLKQSVSRWCYQKIPLDDLCDAAKSIGYRSVELLDPNDWAAPRKHGLVCAMSNGFGTIPVGFNRKDNHDKLVADAERMIPMAAAAGVPNIVCFSGNRGGLSDEPPTDQCD